MEDMKRTKSGNPEAEDPLPIELEPLSEDAGLIDRAAEINSGTAPRKSVRQRIGSMAALRSTDHLVEQAIVAEQRRFLRPNTSPRIS